MLLLFFDNFQNNALINSGGMNSNQIIVDISRQRSRIINMSFSSDANLTTLLTFNVLLIYDFPKKSNNFVFK